MALVAGTRLGPYEIVSPLGAGGMGEVWKARDPRLGRDVAIKISTQQFTDRFEREARAIAALNHSNICTLFDVGPNYLVMELIEGPTLADRIQQGPIPPEEALGVAKQIADALGAAHENDIVHRDLKPANVKIRPDGSVKVLDFGLATAGEAQPVTLDSPTMMPRTLAGMILGTAGYMSPEQARGQAVDKRADIWAFGVVLYEMVTGRRLFDGATVSDSLAAILREEPDLTRAPEWTRRLLRRCLEKDPKKRLRDIGDAIPLLEDAGPPPTTSRGRLAWTIAALLAVAAAASLVFALWSRLTAVPKTATRLTIQFPPGQEIVSYPAITRDGRTVAYVTQQGAEDSQLYLRDLNSFEARAVAGASGARQPFFSPDGIWVAFFAHGQLQKAEVTGGAPVRLADAAYSFGGTWNDDNTIIYAASLGSGLLRIPASGGTPESLTKPDGAAKGYAHIFPQALPGGRSVLFTCWGQTQGGAVLSLDSRQWQVVVPQTGFAVATFEATGGSTGRILLVDQAAGIRAAPFNVAHPGRTSADTSVLANVYSEVETESLGWLAVSTTGTAVYAAGNPAKTSLAWVDREGRIEPLGKDQDAYREASLSPDGAKAVVRQSLGLWIHDLRRGTRSRVTTPANSSTILPLWSHDGTRIIFASNRGGDWDIYSQPADGSRPAEALLQRPYDQFPLSIAPDGTLIYVEIHPSTGRDLWVLSPDGKTSPLRVTPFTETQGQFSPGAASDGPRWVAYSSDESGKSEIYVQSYPGGEHRIPVSTGGGILPRWSRDGKELFYISGDALVSVAVRPDGSFGAPRRLFDRSNFLFNHRFNSYSVSPDGKRFLMIQRDPGSVPRQLNVILNWSDELDRLAPVGNR